MVSIGGVLGSNSGILAQTVQHFRVEHDKKVKTVTLNYHTSSGICYLAQGETGEPVNVYSARDIDDFNHSFNKETADGKLEVNITLDEKNNESFSQSISNKMFSESKPEDNIWKVLLSEDVPYDLNLTYGIGTAYIDLGGMSVKNLVIKTGSADVNIGYLNAMPNNIHMETMNIKVDLGNVDARQIYLANVRNIEAEVGFGNMLLDLAEPMDEPCHIDASVGAGSLEILIPRNEIPVLVRVKPSLLCDVRFSRDFREIADNVFANMEISEDSDTMLEFNVDVSFGSITFKEIK